MGRAALMAGGHGHGLARGWCRRRAARHQAHLDQVSPSLATVSARTDGNYLAGLPLPINRHRLLFVIVLLGACVVHRSTAATARVTDLSRDDRLWVVAIRASVGGCIGEREPPGVAVRGDDMGAGVEITLEMISEECLKDRGGETLGC